MPLNPKRKFDTVLEGPLRLNEDGFWALYEDDEELSYWDEGQELEIRHDGEWVKGRVAWFDEAYGLALPDGRTLALAEGTPARRRVGGSI